MVTINAPWTAVHDTPNKSIRQDVARRGVVLHHAAMTSLSALRDMEVNGTKEVSSTAICKDDAIELVVSDNRYRPWSLSSSYWDSAMRSVETCNESTTGWTVSDKSHWSLAKAVAYWSQTDGFWPHRDGDPTTWTVIGHREVYSIHDASYATACPGGLDLGLVVARAQSIIKGTAPAGSGTTPIEEFDMAQGAFYRNKVDGSIFWQEKPHTPLIPLDGVTWAAYGANGNKFADLTGTQINGIIAKYGTASKPVEAAIGEVTVGDVAVSIDYPALAKAIWDEQAKRIAG